MAKTGRYFDSQIGEVQQNVSLQNFYQLRDCSDYRCTLRLSLINAVPLRDGKTAPILEYKVTFNKPIPHQYMVLDARGYIGNYIRDRRVLIPQITTHTALDFAVLQ